MRQPAWYLLIWAAVVASLVMTLLGLAARTRLGEDSPRRAAVLGFFLGVLLWGPVYGITFELVGGANALGGALLGVCHGALAALAALVRARHVPRPPAASVAAVHGRRIITRLVYGAVFGFLYVVP
jgi:hypothetical protein